ncbi:hypothetical protein [Acidithiobacillus sulfuriphilus]|uniref:Uncharacterized protein n=1 Tax=Acidithiobacillus sulfuriphilus TaxID=1867749 RepID=A0ACD5HJX2_9PROT|nr:hypothetical protein [Acidithiobacillus sulfuriphilus]
MKNKISDLSKVELVFSPSSFASGISSATTNPTSSLPGETAAEAFIHPEVGQTELLFMSLDKLIAYFKNFLVAEIELTINGAVETNGLLRLAITAKGQGGVRVLLKPAETMLTNAPDKSPQAD